MNQDIAVLFAKRFVQRRDVKAVQFNSGAYVPDRELRDIGRYSPYGFGMNNLLDHIAGSATYGHYLLDSDDQCRLFAFDIDLAKTGFYASMDPSADEVPIALGDPIDPKDNSLREAWLNRAHPARPWLKMQMGMLARKFVSAIQAELGIPCAAAYSGNKGVHVYGFTGPKPASIVRQAAHLVIDSLDDWELARGQHTYGHKIEDPMLGYRNFTVEVFPKQDSLDDKDLGNLMRLPLGRNLKSPDPTFFLDLTTPAGVMAPHPDPIRLLDVGNPYE